MSRSVWKGPFVDPSLIKKVEKQKNSINTKPIKTWSRKSTIIPDFVGTSFLIHNGKNLIEDFKIREYIKKNILNSGISKVMIERSTKKCFVTIHTSRPGFVIGKKGSDIEKIKKKISKLSNHEVTLNIKEVKRPELNSYLVAENIAQQLVKRIAYRRAMKRAIQSALRLGAKGIKVCVSGRLAGNEIARTEWVSEGSIPLHTLRADVDYAEAEALTSYGMIGVKVWIYKGKIFRKEFSQETNKI